MECFYASDIGVHSKARNNIAAANKKEGKGCIDKAAAAGSEEATLAAASSKQ